MAMYGIEIKAMLRVTLAMLVLFASYSCLKTEVIITPEEHEAVVEKRHMPEKPKPDHQPDTTETDERVPIRWNPSVEDWKEQ